MAVAPNDGDGRIDNRSIGHPHAVPGIGGVAEDAEFVVFTGVQPGTYDFVVDYRGTTPAYEESAVEYAAESLKPDTTTRGNWGGVYGKEGHILCNYHGDGRDEKQLPAYVTSLDYFRAFPESDRTGPHGKRPFRWHLPDLQV